MRSRSPASTMGGSSPTLGVARTASTNARTSPSGGGAEERLDGSVDGAVRGGAEHAVPRSSNSTI